MRQFRKCISMTIFVDSAIIEEVQQAADWGWILLYQISIERKKRD